MGSPKPIDPRMAAGFVEPFVGSEDPLDLVRRDPVAVVDDLEQPEIVLEAHLDLDVGPP